MMDRFIPKPTCSTVPPGLGIRTPANKHKIPFMESLEFSMWAVCPSCSSPHPCLPPRQPVLLTLPMFQLLGHTLMSLSIG